MARAVFQSALSHPAALHESAAVEAALVACQDVRGLRGRRQRNEALAGECLLLQAELARLGERRSELSDKLQAQLLEESFKTQAAHAAVSTPTYSVSSVAAASPKANFAKTFSLSDQLQACAVKQTDALEATRRARNLARLGVVLLFALATVCAWKLRAHMPL